jgi:hypothetical protein
VPRSRDAAARLNLNAPSYDVLADGRIMKAAASPEGSPWLWTLAFGRHEDPTPTHGYEPTREAAMAAFAKSWRRKYAFGGKPEKHSLVLSFRGF